MLVGCSRLIAQGRKHSVSAANAHTLLYGCVHFSLSCLCVLCLQQSFLSLDDVVSVSSGIKVLKVTHRKDTRTLIVCLKGGLSLNLSCT